MWRRFGSGNTTYRIQYCFGINYSFGNVEVIGESGKVGVRYGVPLMRWNCAGPVLFEAYMPILELSACPVLRNQFLPLDEGDVVAKAEFVIFRGLRYRKQY